jgi:hypothetical protein
MKHFTVINQLELNNGVLLCKKPSGRSFQKAHYKQGDLDGACGAYSIAMVLNILGVFESDELRSDTEFDQRTAEWKLIKALNEEGLYRDGLSSDEILSIVKSNYSKYVNAQVIRKEEHDIISKTMECIDQNNPVILSFDFDKRNGHWVVAVGYATDENDNLTAILTLDSGSNSPRYSLWNGIVDLPKIPKKRYGYCYNSDYSNMVDIGEAIIISKKMTK